MFGLGVTLIEACFYGDGAAAIAAAEQYHRHGKVPDVVPPVVWERLIEPALVETPSARASLLALATNLEALKITLAETPAHVPLPTDGIAYQTLSTLLALGVTPSAATDPLAEAKGLSPKGWGQLSDVLAKNRALEQLRLSSSDIGATDDARLTFPDDAAGLTQLRLRDCKGANLLKALALPCCVATLVEFSVVDCPLGDAGTAAVVQTLNSANPVSLTTLRLVGVGAEFDTVDALSVATADATLAVTADAKLMAGRLNKLSTVALGRNRIGPSGMAHLCATWWQRSGSLTHLDLSGGQFDYFTLGNISQVVRQSPTLKRLDLTAMELSQPAIWQFVSAKKANPVAHVRIVVDVVNATRYSADLSTPLDDAAEAEAAKPASPPRLERL